MTIGEQIQTLRISMGITQEALAEKLDVSRQSVSKWELGQAVPDVEKIIRMSEIFNVSTDKILLTDSESKNINQNPLHMASIYLVVKDFEKSLEFYEKLFGKVINNRGRSGGNFVEYFIDNRCIAIMSETSIKGHCTSYDSPYKFIQNYWVEDLQQEHERVKALGIGEVSEIYQVHPTYHYFNLTDPDNNIIEITGGYHMNADICQSCGMPLTKADYGKNADGSENHDYCRYCCPDGKFSREGTMEEMIEHNLDFLEEFNKDSETKLTREEAREQMMKFFPTLKRWQK